MRIIKEKFVARICALLLLSLLSGSRLEAQDYLYEVGGGFGVAQYFGDANRSLLSSVGFGLGGVGRYNHNFRWAFSAVLDWRKLHGKTDNVGNVFPGLAQADFKASLTLLHLRSEFNFLPYSDGYKYLGASRLSPYIMGGIALGMATGAKDNVFVPGITAGVGVKYKLMHRVNVGVEYAFTALLTDALDALTDKSQWLDDPYHVNDSWIKNKDASGTLFLSITYDFGLRKTICNKH